VTARALLAVMLLATAGCGGADMSVDTYVRWTIIGEEYPSFHETPGGVGAKKVRIDLTGADEQSLTVDASFMQYKLSGLPLGDYVAKVTLLDSRDMPITRGLSATAFTANGTQQSITVDVKFTDFGREFTGNFFFDVAWGGSATCAGAPTPVAKQSFVLMRGAVPIAGATLDGDALDGSTKLACKDGTLIAVGLPWGPAQLRITGYDAADVVLYEKTFNTFIGADLANPLMAFNVGN
jgi:hypothetical protein